MKWDLSENVHLHKLSVSANTKEYIEYLIQGASNDILVCLRDQRTTEWNDTSSVNVLYI